MIVIFLFLSMALSVLSLNCNGIRDQGSAQACWSRAVVALPPCKGGHCLPSGDAFFVIVRVFYVVPVFRF